MLRSAAVSPAKPRLPSTWRSVLSGFCASLIGIGLARFAYTPLLSAIVNAGWFSAPAAAYLGAANLVGYLVGALGGKTLARRLTGLIALRTMMLLTVASFIACAFPLGFLWFFVWRFAAGVAGGALMVLAAPTILPHVSPSRRGLASGIIFMGVGVGVAASGTLVPLLLEQGLQQTWLGLALLTLLLTMIGWGGWPKDTISQTPSPVRATAPKSGRLRALYVEYALNAAGWVPHMIFLVDFIARGLGKGMDVGSQYWVLFGIGATLGPLFAGCLADRIGFALSLRLAFLIVLVAVAIPAFGFEQELLIVSSVVVGAFVTGTVPLVLGRIHELLPDNPSQQKAAWSVATVFFAVFQAVAAYLLSFVFSLSDGDYRLLFLIGTVAMTLALVIDLIAAVAMNKADHIEPDKNTQHL